MTPLAGPWPADSLLALRGRKGAARFADLAPEVLAALNAGALETVNLVEFLAVDLQQLAPHVAGQVGLDPRAEGLQDTLAMLPGIKPMKRHEFVARALYNDTMGRPDRDAVAHRLAAHASDVARCWATYWVGFSDLDLPGRLDAVRRFAADSHFGVREMAWAAVRNTVIAELAQALDLLQAWVAEPDDRLRRFASELTRPRGVWCAQIEPLKAEPWHALPLLEPLKADPSRYVQNSVANWLNDASKSQAEWVREVGDRWLRESSAPATQYIVRRALRTLHKQNPPEPA